MLEVSILQYTVSLAVSAYHQPEITLHHVSVINLVGVSSSSLTIVDGFIMVWERRTWQEQPTVSDPPRLEPSWYEPLSKYMNGHTMLKPQAPLRESNETPDPDVSLNNIDSYGMENTGANGRKVYPDFALCLFTASTTDDTLKAIIEIKHPGKIKAARTSLNNYLELHGDPGLQLQEIRST